MFLTIAKTFSSVSFPSWKISFPIYSSSPSWRTCHYFSVYSQVMNPLQRHLILGCAHPASFSHVPSSEFSHSSLASMWLVLYHLSTWNYHHTLAYSIVVSFLSFAGHDCTHVGPNNEDLGQFLHEEQPLFQFEWHFDELQSHDDQIHSGMERASWGPRMREPIFERSHFRWKDP